MTKFAANRPTPTARNAAIYGGFLYFEDVKQCAVDSEAFQELLQDDTLKAVRVESLSVNWYEREYIAYETVVQDDINMHMTLRKEIVKGKPFWYAYRKAHKKLHKRYLGKAEDIDEKKLLEVARKLPTS